MTTASLASQLDIDPNDFDLDAALTDLNGSFGPFGRHTRLDDEEIDMAWELVEAHRR